MKRTHAEDGTWTIETDDGRTRHIAPVADEFEITGGGYDVAPRRTQTLTDAFAEAESMLFGRCVIVAQDEGTRRTWHLLRSDLDAATGTETSHLLCPDRSLTILVKGWEQETVLWPTYGPYTCDECNQRAKAAGAEPAKRDPVFHYESD